MERVVAAGHDEPTVLVDYAHTPDAVDKVLRTVRPLCRGRLIAVFGCGGDRDRSKRPRMAEAVAKSADLAIATSDNPRTEDPLAILADGEGGLGSLAVLARERARPRQE
jgi:UDP-N-acetylmuramoyl-L-alanyl-D-glutamate--2,6-diaminopimelate ligase